MISFIIITYNNDKFISKAIESCLNQVSNLSKEILVINDGSTDKTLKIINKYKKYVRIFNRRNSGIEKSFNFALKKIKGNYFVRLDSDDYLRPNFLDNFKKCLNTRYEFFYSNYEVINENDKIIYRSNLPKFNKKEIFSRGDFLASGTIFKKEVLNFCNGYNEELKNNGLENYEFILELIQNNCRGFLVKEMLWYYRLHNNNLSKINKNKINLYGKKLFTKKKYGIFKRNHYHPININCEF